MESSIQLLCFIQKCRSLITVNFKYVFGAELENIFYLSEKNVKEIDDGMEIQQYSSIITYFGLHRTVCNLFMNLYIYILLLLFVCLFVVYLYSSTGL